MGNQEERSNDTERLFARMCAPNRLERIESACNQYRSASPSDDKFLEFFSNFEFTANVIDRARYCLEKMEISEQGNHVELDVLGPESVHIEHIMPQKIKTKKAKDDFGDWVGYLGDKAEVLHPKFVSRIGNLAIFSGNLNISASNNPFESKKSAYARSSLLTTRKLTSIQEFSFAYIEQRSRELAEKAVTLWPIP